MLWQSQVLVVSQHPSIYIYMKQWIIKLSATAHKKAQYISFFLIIQRKRIIKTWERNMTTLPKPFMVFIFIYFFLGITAALVISLPKQYHCNQIPYEVPRNKWKGEKSTDNRRLIRNLLNKLRFCPKIKIK